MNQKWRIPKNLESLVKSWKNRTDFFTKKPEEWNWFVKWLDNPDTPFSGYQDRKWDILYAFGHPRIRIPGREPIRPPSQLVDAIKNLAGVSSTFELDRLRNENMQLMQENRRLHDTIENMNTTRMETSCKDVEELVSKQQQEIAELRRQMSLLTDAPLPPMVPPEEAQKVVETFQDNRGGLLDQIRQGKALKKVTPPVKRTEKGYGPQSVLEQGLANIRRVNEDPVEEEEDEFAACRVCQKVTNLTCGVCESVRYCSVSCQAQDWNYHQHLCGTW